MAATEIQQWFYVKSPQDWTTIPPGQRGGAIMGHIAGEGAVCFVPEGRKQDQFIVKGQWYELGACHKDYFDVYGDVKELIKGNMEIYLEPDGKPNGPSTGPG